MAVFKNKMWTGSVGSVRYSSYKDKQIASSLPGKGNVKQTVATKDSANTFGKAQKFYQNFNNSFKQFTHDFNDGGMYTRAISGFNKIFHTARDKKTKQFEITKKSFEMMVGFDFNINSPILDSLRVIPDCTYASNLLTVELPQIIIGRHLLFPAQIYSCKITFRMVLFQLFAGQMSLPKEQSVVIQHNQKVLEAQRFKFEVPNGCLCMTGIYLTFFNKYNEFTLLHNNRDFNPSSICAAICSPGEYVPQKDIRWLPMYDFKLS